MTNIAATIISGEVSGNNGPEAGAWVITETDELNTNFIKIVVTDSDGKFLLPELPEANYRVWMRGYGLKVSSAVSAKTGEYLELEASYPLNAQQAAQIYPASYWYSLLEPPSLDEFSNPRVNANGPLYGVSECYGVLVVVDPKTNSARKFEVPMCWRCRRQPLV